LSSSSSTDPLTAVRTVWARGHWQAARAAREVEATRAFKFETSSQAGREYSQATIRGPPARAIRLSDRPTVCLPRAAGLPARAPRALVLSDSEAFRSGPVKLTKRTTTDTVWHITIHTRYGTSLSELKPGGSSITSQLGCGGITFEGRGSPLRDPGSGFRGDPRGSRPFRIPYI